ncbi:MAG: PAS domain S-box protein [Deltaproteobacteria bacterium]|nr:PAS domain S-box protein [Deltaproteobacteria bacterium]
MPTHDDSSSPVPADPSAPTQRSAEEELVEARMRLAAVVETSDDAIVTKTLDGVIRTWNRGAERIFGYRAEDIVGQPIQRLLPPDRIEEETDILNQLQRGERVDHFETRRVRNDGRVIDVSVTISPLRDASGRVVGASKIARDITDRVRAVEKVRFLADASAALAELSDYESTLQRIAGLSVPAFSDWCWVDMQGPDGAIRRLAVAHSNPERVNFVRDLWRRFPAHESDPRGPMAVMRAGRPVWAPEVNDEVLARFAHDDEHLRAIRSLGLRSFVCVPLKSRTGAIGAVTFMTAESGRAYQLDDLHAAEDLAHRAVITIENSRLLAELKESDRRKDEFLAVLAHELRNPLAPIRNATQVLRAKAPPIPELLWARDVIDRQVSQLTRLVDDLLDVSRIAQGKLELRKQRVALSTVVNDAVEAVRPLVAKWGHQLTVDIPSETVLVEGDASRLAQVLLNLLDNAAKYTDQGGSIRLSAKREGDEVVIRVADNGIGIPPDMLRRIFEMFMQVDRSLERTREGLGIGLTLVERLVALHGGTISANSAGPGTGTEFVVRLPAIGADAAGAAVDRELGDTPVPRGGLRVLVVDDNQDSADSLAMLLRLGNHEVRTANDGAAALGADASFLPDVLVLDIGLPKLNGYEVARRIRAQRGRRPVLVAMTGWGQQEDRRRSSDAGFDHHMTKPIDFHALKAILAGVAASHPPSAGP